MNKSKELELAWAAGFFDGEGSCHQRMAIHRYVTKSEGRKETSYPHRVTSISQYHDPFVLERFLVAVGMGKLLGPYVAKATGNQYWYISYAIKDSIIILGKLLPYLSDPKKKQVLDIFPELVR